MAEIQLGVIEARYADMIWEHEPVSSSAAQTVRQGSVSQ